MRQVALGLILAVSVAGCGGGDKSPSGPTPIVNPKLTAPVPDSPADGAQLDTLRPTLTVKNGTSDQPGTRTYEFQISDTEDFSTLAAQALISFRSSIVKTGVA